MKTAVPATLRQVDFERVVHRMYKRHNCSDQMTLFMKFNQVVSGAAMMLILATTGIGTSKGEDQEPWVNCLFNNKQMSCRRTFLCKTAPCGEFRLEWKDGAKDTFKRFKDGVVSNVGFYRDTRGGEWMLRGFGYPFGLINQTNGNTIIYGMTLSECQSSFGLSDLCGKKLSR